MNYELPDEWYEEHDGQRLVLNSEKVASEIERLRKALEQIALGGYDSHHRLLSSSDMIKIAEQALKSTSSSA